MQIRPKMAYKISHPTHDHGNIIRILETVPAPQKGEFFLEIEYVQSGKKERVLFNGGWWREQTPKLVGEKYAS